MKTEKKEKEMKKETIKLDFYNSRHSNIIRTSKEY